MIDQVNHKRIQMVFKIKRGLVFLTFLGLIFTINSCKPVSHDPALFRALEGEKTGLDFNNKIASSPSFNIFNYMYFYNGGGIGVGDFNNDGKIDVFFASNQGKNKIYLNEGEFKFKDITETSQIPQTDAWSTGVSVVDINNDGLLDLYVSCVGILNNGNFRNQLLVCTGVDSKGIPHYKDEAKDYGLDFQGYSTQAVFFDYDGDGDLDMFLLNHTVRQTGIVGPRKILSQKFNPLTGDRIFKNENGHFSDVTPSTGIYSSVISFGLGVCVSDINLDGYPDLYVGNDFHENDYLYINQHNGTFSEEVTQRMMHTSQFSMGVDIADINNDGYPEIISMDMMPYENYILKRSEGEDDYDSFFDKVKNYGYNYQYTRNNLQYNRKNGMFSEVGTYSGVFATDWSWSALWVDFNNDGLKDLFISNGIPKRMNDIDFIHYVSDETIQSKIQSNSMDKVDFSLIDKFPEIKIPNKFFLNKGDLKFDDLAEKIDNNLPNYSNGAVYADFNNDGNMDLLVNNINQSATIYQNLTAQIVTKGNKPNYTEIRLKGSTQNINALGSKILIYSGQDLRTYEKYPVHGFMSSMEIPIHIGLKNTQVDSAFLVWPDNTYQKIDLSAQNTSYSFSYVQGLQKFNYKLLRDFHTNPTLPVMDITRETGMDFVHQENNFQEFNREQLLPHMLSTEGPALAVGDMNQDGLDDIYIGSSKLNKSALFLQDKKGKMVRSSQIELEKDSVFEDADAHWIDVNHDGLVDLVVASGGNEFYGTDEHLEPRVYLNQGQGKLKKNPSAFSNIYINASCLAENDFNEDGFPDLFIGGRSVPYQYGKIPNSYLLQNDGKGNFRDVTKKIAPELSNIGFVTHAIWLDLNKDGKKDLIVSLEWGGIIAFISDHGHFSKVVLSDKKGWWNFILPVDLNQDGNIDLVVGNLGLNNRLKNASRDNPVRMYYNDFDHNGTKEQVLTYYLNGKEIPFATKDELEKQIPSLRKHYLLAEDFAKATLNEIFDPSLLQQSEIFSADYFSSAVLMNQGNLKFTTKALPWEAQLSPFRTGVVVDANQDNLPDILLMGNYYENNIQMGRYDADFGSLLINKGNGNFKVETLNGLAIKGQVRHILPVKIQGKNSLVLVKNNDSTRIIRFMSKDH